MSRTSPLADARRAVRLGRWLAKLLRARIASGDHGEELAPLASALAETLSAQREWIQWRREEELRAASNVVPLSARRNTR